MDFLGLPSGNKLQIRNFPPILKQKFPEDLLRGIADTDFTVNFRDKDKDGFAEVPRIEGSFSNPSFVSEISDILEKNGISFSSRKILRRQKFSEHRISVEGKKNFWKWMHKIGFANPKHLKKIECWKENESL